MKDQILKVGQHAHLQVVVPVLHLMQQRLCQEEQEVSTQKMTGHVLQPPTPVAVDQLAPELKNPAVHRQPGQKTKPVLTDPEVVLHIQHIQEVPLHKKLADPALDLLKVPDPTVQDLAQAEDLENPIPVHLIKNQKLQDPRVQMLPDQRLDLPKAINLLLQRVGGLEVQ